MTPLVLLAIVLGYFAVLILIAKYTSKNSNQESFFNANKNTPWYVVAYGMIGASLSGVTFMSVPGSVAIKSFSYMQMVLGYIVGYFVVAYVLLPIYYKLNLTSIYQYIEHKLGKNAYTCSAVSFLISRIIGASFRLFLVAIVFQNAIALPLGIDIPFSITVFITIALIWLYTFQGGIKTIVWTDTLQTTFMLLAVCVTIYSLYFALGADFKKIFGMLKESSMTQTFFFEANTPMNFFKMFLSGIFMTIVMTGMDQDMMQKNLTCKTLKDAQKNMLSLGFILVPVNLIFLVLGAMLYLYAEQTGLTIDFKADLLFANIALGSQMPFILGFMFIVGLIAAAYSSADSALTSLTTSFCYDILKVNAQSENIKKIKFHVHIFMSLVLLGTIIIFEQINNESVITELFKVAGYTYGPILGLFSLALLDSSKPNNRLVPIICITAPILSYIIQSNSSIWLSGYKIGFEILLINGLITFTLLKVSQFVKF